MDFMELQFVCPHCDMVQKGNINLNDVTRPKLAICDTDQGGCDKEFIIRIAVHVAITSHKIHGEGQAVKIKKTKKGGPVNERDKYKK